MEKSITKMKIYYFLLIILIAPGLNAQQLEAYQQEAAENNPGLKANYMAFEAALQDIPQAESLPDPTLSMGYFVSPVETRVGPQKARFSLSQMFPWFGTLKAQGDVAALRADARYQAFIEARNMLYYQVAAAYYPLYSWAESVRLEKKNIKILKSYKTIATRQFANGRGMMSDVLRVGIMLKDAETNLMILKDKEKSLRAAFNALLNRQEIDSILFPDDLETGILQKNIGKDTMLLHHPVLRQFGYELAASKASETAAIKQGLPQLGVGLDYVVVSEREDMALPDNGKDVLMPMVSLSIPVFRGKYKAAVKKARLMQQRYKLQQEDYANALKASYESTLFEIRKQQELVNLYEAQVKDAEHVLNLLVKGYGNSGKEFGEVLRMQQQLVEFEKMKATAISQYHVAIAKLKYVAGY